MKLYAEVDDKDRKLKTLYGIVEYMDGTRLVCDKFYAVKEQEPCSDAISRQAVLELIADYDLSMGQVVKGIHALPSVKPQEPKTGHWEYVQYDYNPRLGNWHCSECRCVIVACVDKNEKCGIPLYKYCPNCGAKMESEEA